MKDLVEFLKDMNHAACTLLLVPVASYMSKTPVAEVYDQWYYEYIVKKFL